MPSFNEYWKVKVAKRRRLWAAKAKRYADRHSQLEEIRKEVYLPLDFNPGFRLDDLKLLHFTEQNSFIRWDKDGFTFSEAGLRSALEAQGATAREALLRYCELDTLAMVKVWEKLKNNSL